MNMVEHPILFYVFGIPVHDTVLYTWITMGIILLTALLLKAFKPDFLELALEAVISVVDDAMDVDDLHQYIPLLGSLMIFVLFSNLISLFPVLKAPTADLNTTIALSLIVVLSVHFFGMAKKGVWKYLKEFASPVILLPIEIIGQLSRTLSLSMRLFGNILSSDMIVAIVFSIIPFLVPIAFTALSIFSSVLQAYVITTLAALFISSAVEINEEDKSVRAAKPLRSKRGRRSKA